MIPAGFGAIQAAIKALDAQLDPPALAALDEADTHDAWRAAAQVCDAADALYAKMRSALASHVATRRPEESP